MLSVTDNIFTPNSFSKIKLSNDFIHNINETAINYLYIKIQSKYIKFYFSNKDELYTKKHTQ